MSQDKQVDVHLAAPGGQVPSAASKGAPCPKHTPGPWSRYPCALEGFSQVITAKGAVVMVAHTDEISGGYMTYGPCEETEANARLIAAAPELLQALQDAVAEIRALSGKDNSCGPAVDVSAFEAVIAKATGSAA